MEQFLDYIIFVGTITTVFALAIGGIYVLYRFINYLTNNKLEDYINSLHYKLQDFDEYEE